MDGALFRRALEVRLNKVAETELIQVNRLRRQVAFDRLLARLFRIDPAPWVLKGGYALELRFRTARATIDIDLTVQRVAAAAEADANQILRDMLQDTASFSLGDWFEYTIGPPVLDLDAAPYGGARYPVETRMDGRIFVRRSARPIRRPESPPRGRPVPLATHGRYCPAPLGR